MSTITLQDLTRDPVAFLTRVEAGEHILLLRDSRPVAEVRPILESPLPPRLIGLAAGEFTVPEDFDAPLPDDVLRSFDGQ